MRGEEKKGSEHDRYFKYFPKCHNTGKLPINLSELCEWIWLSSYLTSDDSPNSSNSALLQHEALRPADAGDRKPKVAYQSAK